MNGARGEARVLRALVVEDEPPARCYLVETLQATGLARVIAAVATADEARDALGPEGIEVEVAFLDVNLATSGGEEAGLSLVRSLAASPGAPAIVLTTALRQHALEAYDLGIADYLLKPFSEERVRQCLERVLARRPPGPGPARPERVVARRGRSLVFLRREEVWAFEASGRLTYVHTPRGRFDVDLTLSTLESSLPDSFARAHRCWLINLEHVRSLEREDGDTELLLGSDASSAQLRVPVARDRAAAIRDLLLESATGIRRKDPR